MFYRVIGNLDGSCVITKKRRGIFALYTNISQQPTKPNNLRGCGGKSSKFSFSAGPRDSCLFLGLPCNERSPKKDAISCNGAPINWITRPGRIRISVKLELTR